MSPEAPAPSHERSYNYEPKTIAQMNDIVRGVLMERFPDRAIELTTTVSHAASKFKPHTRREAIVQRSNLYDGNAQAEILSMVLWSYILKHESKAHISSPTVFLKRLEEAEGEKREVMQSLVELHDTLYKETLKRL
ncbi:MAG TPA: hypothetical protein PK109_00085 [Candidatus Paceibacterota bacterium]|nr:hypothetical protein [Candidatus Paceibacterota bacterium]